MCKGCAVPNMDGVMVDMDAPFGDQGADGEPITNSSDIKRSSIMIDLFELIYK